MQDQQGCVTGEEHGPVATAVNHTDASTAVFDRSNIAASSRSPDRLSTPEPAVAPLLSFGKETATPNRTVVAQGEVWGSEKTKAADASDQGRTDNPPPIGTTEGRSVFMQLEPARPTQEAQGVHSDSEAVSPGESSEFNAHSRAATSRSIADNRAVDGESHQISKPAAATSTLTRDGDSSDSADRQTKPVIKGKVVQTQIEPVHATSGSGGIVAGASAPPHFERHVVAKSLGEDSSSSPATVHEPENLASSATRPLRAISLQLGIAASDKVDVQVASRGGKIQVAVRTPDQDLTKSLQTNLGDLVTRLEDKGFKTEAWTPSAVSHSPNIKDPAGAANSENQSDNSGASHSGSQGGQDADQRSGQHHPGRWKEQLEETLSIPNALTYEEQTL